MVLVEQNLFLCFVLSTLAGAFTLASKLVVLQLARRRKGKKVRQPEQAAAATSNLANNRDNDNNQDNNNDKKKNPERFKDIETYLVLTCFVIANMLANACIFLAPWFGPIAIYWPAYIASQLLCNMLVAICLQHERLDKPAQIATLVVVAAVLYITLTGPGGRSVGGAEAKQQAVEIEKEDIRQLLTGNWSALAWLGLLSLVFVVAFLIMMVFLILHCRQGRRQAKAATGSGSVDESSTTGSASPVLLRVVSPVVLETMLLLVSITCSALSATTSKAASTLTNPEDATLRACLFVASWFVILCWSVENYLEGRHVRSLGQFLPAVTFGSILLNAATGLIVWKDAHVVSSWAGYATALCLLGLGVYLISDLDFFKAQLQEQQDYQRQIATWQDLFATLEEDLSRARVEQSLSRHQRTILSEHSRMGSLTRGLSDPELGTRGESMIPVDAEAAAAAAAAATELSSPSVHSPADGLSIRHLSTSTGGLASTTSGSWTAAPPSASSSVSFASSSNDALSVDLLSVTPPRPRRHPSSQRQRESATDRTLASLERLAASVRTLSEWETTSCPGNQSMASAGSFPTPKRNHQTSWAPVTPRTIVMMPTKKKKTTTITTTKTSSISDCNSVTDDIPSAAKTLKTSPSFTVETVSGHSRDSSILSILSLDEEDFDFGLAEDEAEAEEDADADNDGLEAPPPPPPIVTPPRPIRRSMGKSPYRRRGKHGMMIMSSLKSSPTTSNLHKSLDAAATPDHHHNTNTFSRVLSWNSNLGDLEDFRLDEDDNEDLESVE